MNDNTKPTSNRAILPLVLFFCVTTVLLIAGKSLLVKWGVDQPLLVAGNMLLFTVSLISLLLYQRAMAHATTMGFLRNTYSGLFFKLIVCAVAAIVYVLLHKEHVNKPGLFACIFLYFVYTLLEMRSLMQWNKARRNA